MDTLARLLLTWFGNPVRALATAMISSAILLGIKWWKPSSDIMRDEFWRWPVLVLVVSSAGLSTYVIERIFKWVTSCFADKRARQMLFNELRNLTVEER